MSTDFALTTLTNLTHHFLIALPSLEDGIFSKSVVYLCEHNERGALGLIINKASDINWADLFTRIELPLTRADLLSSAVLLGGPMQPERGFVLHEASFAEGHQPPESVYAATLAIPGGLEMTTSKDVLEALSNGAGPRKVLVTLGYAAWGEGQLEKEIADNFWLMVAADTAIIFDAPLDQRYNQALALLGLQPWMLFAEAGHA
jgi:putative transcriptional regulator